MCSESHVVQPVDFYTKRSLPPGFASAMLPPLRNRSAYYIRQNDASFTHSPNTDWETSEATLLLHAVPGNGTYKCFGTSSRVITDFYYSISMWRIKVYKCLCTRRISLVSRTIFATEQFKWRRLQLKVLLIFIKIKLNQKL